MTPHPSPEASRWGERALEYARALANLAPGRGSATEAEAQAAAYVRKQLAALGVERITVQAFSGLRSIWLFLSLAFGAALVGHAAYWLLGQPLGTFPGSLLALITFAFSGYLLWCKFTFRDYPLRQVLPHGPSQNVIAILPPGGPVRKRVVLTGHLDSHRAVWWFASDFLVKTFALVSPLAVYGVALAPLLYLLAALPGLSAFAWGGLALAFPHFLGWFTGVTADLGPFSPGANDNASGAGSLLALGERLRRAPLVNTEVWLVFTGCEETGCDGMRALLAEYVEALKDAFFLNFELVGIGDRLAYLKSEGIVRKRRAPPKSERLVVELGSTYGIQALEAASVGAFTETGVVWERGLQGVCLMATRGENGLMPEWHRLSDTASCLEAGSLERAHQLAWDILQKLDRTN